MAEGLIATLVPQTVGGVAGIIGTLLFGTSTAWLSFRKARVDETTMILEKWREMNDRHVADVKDIRDELRAERADNAKLRERLGVAEATIARLNRKINEQDDLIAGLVRQLAQLGQSTFHVLGENAPPGLRKALNDIEEQGE